MIEKYGEFPKGSKKLGEVAEFVVVQTLQILLLQQDVDTLLDVRDLRNEAGTDLADGFADKLSVLHLLPGLHDADNSRLDNVGKVSGYKQKD